MLDDRLDTTMPKRVRDRQAHQGLPGGREHLTVCTVDQHEALHHLGVPRGDLKADLHAHRPADKMGPFDALGLEDRPRVGRMGRDPERPWVRGARRVEEPAIIPRDEANSVGERVEQGQPRVEPTAEAIGEHHGLGAVADDLLREKLLEWLEAHSTVSERKAEPTGDAPSKDAKPAKGEKAAKEEKAAKGAKEEKAEKAGKGEKASRTATPEDDA